MHPALIHAYGQVKLACALTNRGLEAETVPAEIAPAETAPADRAEYRKQAGQMKERLVSWLESVHSPHLNGVKQRSL